MVRTLLVRGMIAGLIAGLVYAVFAYVFGEPALVGGLGYEDQVAAASGEPPGVELVSRGVQATVGLAVAAAVYGVAIGGIFALVYAAVYGRVGRLSPRATAAVLALVGFVVVYAVPFMKYPSNPPASSIDTTIADRTGLYVVMVLFSVVLASAAVALGRRLVAQLEAWNATLVAAGAYIVSVGIVGFLMPRVSETPADFPATVVYDFRLASLGGQLVLWACLGLVFGALVDGSSRRRHTQREVDAPAR